MRGLAAAFVVVWVAVAPRAAAGPVTSPRGPTVIHVPTAWLQPAGGGHGAAGPDHRGGGSLRLTGGLGGLADVDVEVGDRVVVCDPCDGARAVAPAWIASAGFKLGARLGDGAAVALGVRRSFAGRGLDRRWGASGAPDIAEAFVVGSVERAGVRLHAGAAAWAAADDDRRLAAALRPLGGLEWTPAQYPRTTLVAEVSWAPELRADEIALGWLAGWGVRYQALAWGSIELAVRHREGDGLDASTVLVRVAGVISRSRK